MNKIAGDLNEYGMSQRRFLQNVTHELKTPVMSIRGYAEGIRDGVIEDKEKALNVMIGECERLARLVNEVLYLSKLETVEEFYSFKNEKLNEVIEEIRDKIQSIMDKSGITIELKLDHDCSVNMDRDKLTQALLNLLSNALKYTKPGGSIQVNIYDRIESVVISVKDSGIGISDDKKNMIFERFRQVNSSLTRENEGSGIGLSLVKSLVELHGGTINLTSQLGKGSSFVIELPIKVLEADDERPKPEPYLSKNQTIERIQIEFSDIYHSRYQ
jgi:signal transduction histidine kinase